MEIFVISLPSDHLRRENLKKNFPLTYYQFNFIDAIDKTQIYSYIEPHNIRKTRVVISDVEIACALSHTLIYKRMILDDLASCIVFEDDILGNDCDIHTMVKIYNKLPKDSVLLAGGMDGMRSMNYLYGELVLPNVYRVHPAYYQFLVRACCYVVPKKIASKILESQKYSLIRADEWESLLKNENNIYFSPIFHHPLDLTNSHLETARRNAFKGFFKRLFKEGVLFTISRILKRNFLRLFAKFRGFKSIF